MPKFAIGLRGKSDKYYKVVENVQRTVLDDLQDKHIYISTYDHPDLEKMMQLYRPSNTAILTDSSDGSWYQGFYMTCVHTIALLRMIQKSDVEYEWIILTRLDAAFDHELSKLFPLDPARIHTLCKCEKEPLVDDNLWIFTPDKIDGMITSMMHILSHRLMTHDVKQVYETHCGKSDMFAYLFPGEHYICNARPFMKFAREIPYM